MGYSRPWRVARLGHWRRMGRNAGGRGLLLWPLVLLASLGLVAAFPARGDDVVLSVAPASVEVLATPGGEGRQEITVFNEGEHPIVVTAIITAYRDAVDEFSAQSWLTAEPGSFEIPANGSRNVTVTIKSPPEFGTGGRYAQLTIRARAKDGEATGAGLAGEIGVPFLITAQSQQSLVRQASVEGVFPLLRPDGLVGFVVDVANPGNIHFMSSARVELLDANGLPQATIEAPETTAILPKTRAFVITDGGFPLEKGQTYRCRVTSFFSGGIAPEVVEGSYLIDPGLRWTTLAVAQESNGTLRVMGGVENPSHVAIYGTPRMAVADASGNLVRASANFPPYLLLPGMTLEGSSNLAWKLDTGDYTLIGIVAYGTLDEARHTTSFKIGAAAQVQPSREWGEVPERLRRGPAAWLIALAVAGFLSLLLMAGLWLPFLAPCRRRLRVALHVLTGAYEKPQQPSP